MNEIAEAEDQMKKVIARLQLEFSSLRTGRAHLALLEGIKADYYGTSMPISQLSNISIVDARTIEIKPWDKEGLQSIEQAILKSDLNITPQNDGKIIRLIMPTPTAERRKELVRHLRKQAEEFRIAIRNIRREAVEKVKRSEKEKKVSEDDLRTFEHLIQKSTDHFIKTVDDLLAIKEKEVLEV